MFEFYRVVFNPDTNTEEINKFQYDKTEESLPLKEKLEKEVDNYEIYTVTYVDRYYHCDRVEECYPISLSQAVFNCNDEFIGYMKNDTLYLNTYEQVPVRRDVRGATSIKVDEGIRRRR